MPKQKQTALIPQERIISKIYLIRGKKVMFDFDLAEMYGVRTKKSDTPRKAGGLMNRVASKAIIPV